MKTQAVIEYLPVEPGTPLACPHCGLDVTLRIDDYKCLQRTGGCSHIVVTEQSAGNLRLGFCKTE